MELTRTNAVFSRIAMVLFLCRNKSSQNDLELHGDTFQKIIKNTGERIKARGLTPFPRGWGRASPLPRGPPGAPPTSTPTPYIHVRGEKNQREGFIAFYDTEAPQALNSPGRADLESVRVFGEGNPSPSSTILHHQFRDAHRRA